MVWAQASEGARPDTQMLEDLIKRFKWIFDRPNFAGCVADRLFTRRQGARSVVEYAVVFETLWAEAGWNEPVLLCAFRRGLNDQVCDVLVVGGRLKDLAP